MTTDKDMLQAALDLFDEQMGAFDAYRKVFLKAAPSDRLEAYLDAKVYLSRARDFLRCAKKHSSPLQAA